MAAPAGYNSKQIKDRETRNQQTTHTHATHAHTHTHTHGIESDIHTLPTTYYLLPTQPGTQPAHPWQAATTMDPRQERERKKGKEEKEEERRREKERKKKFGQG